MGKAIKYINGVKCIRARTLKSYINNVGKKYDPNFKRTSIPGISKSHNVGTIKEQKRYYVPVQNILNYISWMRSKKMNDPHYRRYQARAAIFEAALNYFCHRETTPAEDVYEEQELTPFEGPIFECAA